VDLHSAVTEITEEVARPRPRAGEAVIRITATTICGTDVRIVKGDYPLLLLLCERRAVC
jgi:threonine dehydrogenase-like Zn-dependent dehydrogenase